jgi:hypothetical protein
MVGWCTSESVAIYARNGNARLIRVVRSLEVGPGHLRTYRGGLRARGPREGAVLAGRRVARRVPDQGDQPRAAAEYGWTVPLPMSLSPVCRRVDPGAIRPLGIGGAADAI